ncbi:activating transcription factor 7-interacting protein 1 isoform X2 [Trichomycterus rosablanca]|uniref:activating transcription factor 7-interacting protein 1 isoform X2 n=1 Tax=Trichomycterus rosablanca TaxID=2290929 RepID=UPI002F3507B1
MEVAILDEPQKKIFRARKTMKMSDRQQLEALHNTLSTTVSNPSSPDDSSSRPQTPLVNGTHTEEEQRGTETEKETGSKSPTALSSGSSPLPSTSLSLSRSPSPAVNQSRNASPSSLLKKDSEMSKGEEEAGEKDKNDGKNTEKTEMLQSELDKSPSSDNNSDQKTPVEKVSNGDLAMDTVEEKSTKSLSSSPTGSPVASLECDPEVKEGFLCLSEEDEGQAEQDEVKKEKMDVDSVKEEKAATETGCTEADGTGSNSSVNKKRSWSPVDNKDEWKDEEIKEERDGKRARVEGVQLEAQLELKITAEAGGRLKLEKVVQQLVEERLRVLQLTLFDHSLLELKERVEKIDAATKQQNTVQHINTLQSKISRLAKKFGAANQASENLRKEAAAAKAASTASATNVNPGTQRTVRTMIDSKQTTATPNQPRPLLTPTTATSSALAASAPILQIISTTTNSTPSSSSSSLSGQGQTSTLLLQPRPNTGAMATSTVTSAGQPVSLPPLLIQLPLAMANGQGGTIAGGVNLIPVSSLANVSSINKAKTTTATTFILQKTPGGVVPSTSSTVLSSSSPTVTQLPVSRPVYQGGMGTAASPSAGISVTTARTPLQSATVVGMATASSSPATTGPAATGSAAAANGPPSASEMTSKTDNQATHSAPAKTPTQSARPKSSVIDLTEDDDDVQLTSVQKPASTQRPTGPPPPLVNSNNAGRTGVQHRPSVDSPRSRPSSTSSAPLPPLPLAPAPPARLPPEAAHTSSPQQPQLKLARVQSQNGIVLSWCVSETERNCAPVDSYHLYAYHQDQLASSVPQSTQSAGLSLWKKIGEVKALPLPMACTLTQFVSGSTYYFAVRAKDIYGRFGPFCEPQCTDVINPPSSSTS